MVDAWEDVVGRWCVWWVGWVGMCGGYVWWVGRVCVGMWWVFGILKHQPQGGVQVFQRIKDPRGVEELCAKEFHEHSHYNMIEYYENFHRCKKSNKLSNKKMYSCGMTTQNGKG